MKILVVEDTPKNLDTAKAFFSTITDHEFVYATNCVDAATLLDEVDAVITDQSIPYSATQELGYTHQIENNVRLGQVWHGNFIALKAMKQTKSAIVISQHGEGILLIMRSSIKDGHYNQFTHEEKHFSDCMTESGGLDLATSVAEMEEQGDILTWSEKFDSNIFGVESADMNAEMLYELLSITLGDFPNSTTEKWYQKVHNLSGAYGADSLDRLYKKTETRSWALAWDELQKQL